MTGTSANLFLLGSDSRIIAAYYPVTPVEHGTRTLLPGVSYVVPGKKALRPDREIREIPDAGSPNDSADAFYVRLALERNVAALRSEVRSSIKKAAARAERRRVALEADLGTADRAEELKLAGDLVLANLKLLHAGMDHAELTGYDGRTVTVKLDPKVSPSKNAELYFKKYKKAKAGQQIISTRLHDTAEEITFLSSQLDETEKAG